VFVRSLHKKPLYKLYDYFITFKNIWKLQVDKR